MALALLALAISAFAIGTTEFLPTGPLPEIAAELAVDIPAARFTVTVRSPVPTAITLFLLGVVAFATVPGLQARVLDAAGTAGAAASAVDIGVVNQGNAAGAWLGVLAISAGFGLTAMNPVGAAMAAAGVAVALVSLALERRRTPVTV